MGDNNDLEHFRSLEISRELVRALGYVAASVPVSTLHENHLAMQKQPAEKTGGQLQRQYQPAELTYPACNTVSAVSVVPRAGPPQQEYFGNRQPEEQNHYHQQQQQFAPQQMQLHSALNQQSHIIVVPFFFNGPVETLQERVLQGMISRQLPYNHPPPCPASQPSSSVVEIDVQEQQQQHNNNNNNKRDPPKHGVAKIWVHDNRFEEVPAILDHNLKFNWIPEDLVAEYRLRQPIGSPEVSDLDWNGGSLNGRNKVEVAWLEPSGKLTHKLLFYVVVSSRRGVTRGMMIGDPTLKEFGERAFDATWRVKANP